MLMPLMQLPAMEIPAQMIWYLFSTGKTDHIKIRNVNDKNLKDFDY